MTSDWWRLLSHWLSLGYASRAHPPRKMPPARTNGTIRLPMTALTEIEQRDTTSGQQRRNKYLLSDIRNTLLKARFALPQDAEPEAVKVLDERFNEHLTFKLCEDLALSLCNLFGNKEDDNTLSATIEKYIKENYKDPSLGLNKISDEFQISESYFSHMFKEKTGVNFSTYLENIRMTEAARLIKETDISLNELYIAVGYNNSNTFRRAFKKVYGVTPSAMREK